MMVMITLQRNMLYNKKNNTLNSCFEALVYVPS